MTLEEPPTAETVVVETATDTALAGEIADVAAVTFPLACPAHSTPENIAAHIATVLSAEAFAGWIAHERHDVIVARDGEQGPIVGYALVVHGAPTAPDVRLLLAGDDVSEVSKMYVLPAYHAAHRAERPSHRLMAAALESARERGSSTVWLGVHQDNVRAQTFYRKTGFTQIGTKTFDMNGVIEHDHVMARRV
ncbi:MAG: GNAT family N-acetyltransferase [Gordonia sp. (in: high G+C Gram-positive bacteria)]